MDYEGQYHNIMLYQFKRGNIMNDILINQYPNAHDSK